MFGQRARYKIELKSLGYRLVYEIRGAELVVLVVAVGKRKVTGHSAPVFRTA